MFKKILIANRGEIACRVIKTCKRLGIATVAVYSDADKNALHVQMADEAVRIGPPPSSESYLKIETIVQACLDTGAEAVHPGYGFLSERLAFREALDKAGVVFIGPPAKAIKVMGDKIESKVFAANAGVNTVPGSNDLIEDDAQALEVSKSIGFPVMIKASAGGGGKGMRIAYDESEVAEGFRAAKSEAASSFGDDRIFIEKFIETPRHIEIQVLADQHGTALYLGERECSLQRRNQKVVEEAPSSFLDEKTRAAMGEHAVALARAVDYESAGTAEFIVDKHKNFYFLEMNTRLQVEHPVTELITGIDLVEQMLRVAAGEKLVFGQNDIKLTGWSVEGRVYAEDPFSDFLPSIGRLVHYAPPQEIEHEGLTVRNDTGVYEGAEISMYYDPMIAKLVTHAPTREEAIDAMSDALDAFQIAGINHNIPFLSAIMVHPRWRSGDISTNFIREEFPDGFGARALTKQERTLLSAVATLIDRRVRERIARITTERVFKRPVSTGEICVGFGQNDFVEVHIEDAQSVNDTLTMALNVVGETQPVVVSSSWKIGETLWRGKVDGKAVIVQVHKHASSYELSWRGVSAHVRPLSRHIAALEHYMPEKKVVDTSKTLLAPMAGVLLKLDVKEGDKVDAAQALCVIEAMKMENMLRAEKAGQVKAIHFSTGDNVNQGDVLIEFE